MVGAVSALVVTKVARKLVGIASCVVVSDCMTAVCSETVGTRTRVVRLETEAVGKSSELAVSRERDG